MNYSELQNGKFYRLTLEPRDGGLVLNNARIKCVIPPNTGERHLIVQDDRYLAECQFRVEPNGELLRFDYSGTWLSGGGNIKDCVKESP